MARRRPFRRRSLRGRPLRRPPLPPRARRALIRANRLMDTGSAEEAAALFDRLIERADRAGLPLRAAALRLQASRAYLRANDVDSAAERAERGLLTFARNGQIERTRRLLARATDALREQGYVQEAEKLKADVESALEGEPTYPEEADEPEEAQRLAESVSRASLPASCTGCGAPLVPEEVEWHNAHTAECLYCGTIVKGV